MNIGEWISKRAKVQPEKPLLKEKDKVYNNRQFNERVNKTANALCSLGVSKGDRVAVLLANCSEFLEIFFACAKTGAIMVPFNFRLAVPELVYIVADSAPCLFIYSGEFAAKVEAIKAAGVPVKKYFRLAGELPGDKVFFNHVRQHSAAEPPIAAEVGLSDPLFIMYTSGTTGDPKGATITHQNILFGAIHSLLGYGIDRSYKSLVVAPLFHLGALAASVTPIIYAGGSIVISSFYNASEMLNTICKEKINYMFAVPVMYQLMAEAEEWQNADLSHVHFFISGGAPIPLPVIKKYQEEKRVGFVQGYALTETGRLTSLDLEDSISKAGSVGKEVFHVRLRIVDEQDNELPPQVPGELLVKGPNVFAGYWGKEAATELAMKGGWFHTGDIGQRDDEGFVYIVGRKVEMIISSGENIYPAEVERAITSLPQVKEAAAVGMTDKKRGEVVAAYVILKNNVCSTENEILEALQGKIAHYKIPKKIIFVEEFPRNQSGKVLKRVLKNRLEIK
ncbi:MAG: o-succinylbenzoate--CoA ligase [Deltaproteobacteria bacterium HGW-Deltaproteobacteria-12]|nr:MAG: o-succinylbenzoate--CoA ligase [Deltaproteobacteria bacterium HGW-Deltaproteobacteria-12]